MTGWGEGQIVFGQIFFEANYGFDNFLRNERQIYTRLLFMSYQSVLCAWLKVVAIFQLC